MSGRNLLIDSNIVIYLSKKKLELDSFAKDDDLLHISIITYMEAKGYNFVDNKEKDFIETFCKRVNIIKLLLLHPVVYFMRLTACSLLNNFNLVTHNIEDFTEVIPANMLIDPMNK